MFTIFGVQTKVTSLKNISNLKTYTAQTNIKTDRQTNFKLSNGNTFNNGTTGKGRSFK